MIIEGAFILPHPPLLVPSVGRGQEEDIFKTVDSYKRVAEEISRLKPDTIVIISPHSTMYQDYIHISPGSGASGNFSKFGDRSTSIAVDYDRELVSEIERLASENLLAAGTLGERERDLDHGTLVPLYFINRYFKEYKVVRVSVSGLTALDHYRLGKCIGNAVENLGRRTVIVASGDLSHKLKEEGPYNYAEEGPEFDRLVTEAMAKGSFLTFMEFGEGFCEAAGECGLKSFIVMAGCLDGRDVDSRLLSYEGPFGVGYAVATFYPLKENKERQFDRIYKDRYYYLINEIRQTEDPYVKLARRALETYVTKRKYIDKPVDLPLEMMEEKAGVFVSIKSRDRLRGCIGTISPTEGNIADEIIRNAVSAGTGDPRFDPIGEDELDLLIYSVDVLGKPEAIQSIDELDVLHYGVIVSKGRKRGLLLPNLDGVKTVNQQVEIALKKAGISPKDDYSMERFSVVRHL